VKRPALIEALPFAAVLGDHMAHLLLAFAGKAYIPII